MEQFVGAVAAVQLKPIAVEDVGVAVSPVGAAGLVVHCEPVVTVNFAVALVTELTEFVTTT